MIYVCVCVQTDLIHYVFNIFKRIRDILACKDYRVQMRDILEAFAIIYLQKKYFHEAAQAVKSVRGLAHQHYVGDCTILYYPHYECLY